jgi:multiple sugar transport system ATP-binding protein
MFGSPGMNLVEGRLEAPEGQLVFVAGSAASGASTEAECAGFTLPVAPCHREKLQSRVGKPITLGVRPEHVLPASECGPDALRFPATVEAVEPIGPETHVRANAGGQPFVLRTGAAPGLRAGDRIELGVAPECLYFDSESGQRL